MSTEQPGEISPQRGPGFSTVGHPDPHMVNMTSYSTTVDKSRSTEVEQTLEYRGQNFNFQFASAGAEAGTIVQDVGNVIQETGLFEQSGHFEGQLFPGHTDDKNSDFQFPAQQAGSEFTSGQELEFIERNSVGGKRPLLVKTADNTSQHQTSNVIIYMPSDVQICEQSSASPEESGDTFGRNDTTQAVNFIGNLSDIKSTAVSETSGRRGGLEKRLEGVSVTLPRLNTGRRPSSRSLASECQDDAQKPERVAVEEVPTVSIENFLRENSTPEAHESVKDELKPLKVPPDLPSLTSVPRLNAELKQRLTKDAGSRHEKTLTSALSTLSFDERSSLYQQQLVEILKPLIRILELIEASPLDADAMRRMLGSVVALVASLQDAIIADRRKCVMTHYGFEDSVQVIEQAGVELFSEQCLLRNGFIQRKDAAISGKRHSKRKPPSSGALLAPAHGVVSLPVKRKRMGKLSRRSRNPESDADIGGGDEIAQIIILDDSVVHHENLQNTEKQPQLDGRRVLGEQSQSALSSADKLITQHPSGPSQHEEQQQQQQPQQTVIIAKRQPRAFGQKSYSRSRQLQQDKRAVSPKQLGQNKPTSVNTMEQIFLQSEINHPVALFDDAAGAAAATAGLTADIQIVGFDHSTAIVKSTNSRHRLSKSSAASTAEASSSAAPSVSASCDGRDVQQQQADATMDDTAKKEPITIGTTNGASVVTPTQRRRQQQRQQQRQQANHRESAGSSSTMKRKETVPVKCSFCERSFTKRLQLAQHLKQTHSEELPQCNICNRRFAFETTLQQHVEEKHTAGVDPGQRHECEHCTRTFSDKNRLQAHLFIHTGTKQFECSICSRRCLTKAHLDQHMAAHGRGEERFYCERCEKSFAKKTNYKHHMRLHSGEKNFECELCHKRFATRQYLHIHLRSHSTEKPFTCDICGRGFQFQHVLVDHVRTHTGETPFVCEVCGISFKVKRTLKRHMKTHGDERPHSCHICQRGFKVKATLREHMKTHSNEKPYQCHECGLAYKRNVELRKHACSARQQQQLQQQTLIAATTPAPTATVTRLPTAIQLAVSGQHSAALAHTVSSAGVPARSVVAGSAVGHHQTGGAGLLLAGACDGGGPVQVQLADDVSGGVGGPVVDSHHATTAATAATLQSLQTVIPMGAAQPGADGTATTTIILQPMSAVGGATAGGANFAGIHFINL